MRGPRGYAARTEIGSHLFRPLEALDECVDTPRAAAMKVDDDIAVGNQRGDGSREAGRVRAFFVPWEHTVQVDSVRGIDPGIAAFDLGSERVGGEDDAQASSKPGQWVLAEHPDRQGRPWPFIAVGPGDESRARATWTGFAILERNMLGGSMGRNPDLVPFQRFIDGFHRSPPYAV